MSESTVPATKRRRPALSCEQCRRRKIRCDRICPCGPCRQSKNARCTYSPNIRAIDGRYVSRGGNTQPHIPSSTVLRSVGPPVDLWEPPTPESQRSTCPPIAQAFTGRVHKVEQLVYEPSVAAKISNPSCETPEPDNLNRHLRGTLSKTRFFGQSHWLHSFGMFGRISCVRENGGTSIPSFNDEISSSDVGGLLERCKAMARAAKLGVHNEFLADPAFKESVPSRELGDVLVSAYFRTGESAYRILHVPSFQKEYEKYWEEPLNASPGFILKMLLAMAIGSSFYQGPDGETVRSQAKKWTFAAQSWLSQSPLEKHRLNISGLQIHCLLLLARQACGIVGDLIWISTGALMRAAFNMGLHRDPKYFPRMTFLQAELRRRLWATILEFNAQSSLDSGMNPLVTFDDFDTEPPANLNDEDFDENTTTPPMARPAAVFTQASLQILLLRSLQTRLEIIRVTNGFRSEPPYEDILKRGEDLSSACKESNALFQTCQSQEEVPGPTQFHRNLHDILLRRFLLVLHRPFAIKAQKDHRYYFSRKVVLDCAITMMTYPTNASGMTQPLKHLPRDDFTCFKTCDGGFFRGVIIHSAMAILLELLLQLEEQASFREQSKAFREPLKQILRDTIELTAERIAIAENNLKGHLFISAVLGQVEAIEAGTSPEMGAVDGAMRSARASYELLAARVPSLTAEREAESQEALVSNTGGEMLIIQDQAAMDLAIQNWNIDFFDLPDSWRYSGFEEDKCW